MYQNVSKEAKQDQYKLLLMRAHKKAKLSEPGLSMDAFACRFRDPDVARGLLSPDDFGIYMACRDAAG